MNIYLKPDDIQIGQPVRFNIFDRSGHLLLRQGNIVANQHQLNDLLARGWRSNEAAVGFSANALGSIRISVHTEGRLISVIKLLREAETRFGSLLANPPIQGFVDTLKPIAMLVRRAYRLDRDAATALVLMQHGPSYPIYHHIHTAIISLAILDHSSAELSETTQISIVSAALTMNIAMLALQATLWRSATPPTPAQRCEIDAHPQAGVELLRSRGVDDPLWLTIVAEHHEAIDGSGYPMHLKGEEISQAAQVVAIADRYCAMVSGRRYREPMLAKRVLGELFLSRVNLDHEIAILLIQALGVYPTGSLVKLTNKEIAVVTKLSDTAHQPVVRSVLSDTGHYLIPAITRATNNSAFTIVEAIPASRISFQIDFDKLWDHVLEPHEPDA